MFRLPIIFMSAALLASCANLQFRQPATTSDFPTEKERISSEEITNPELQALFSQPYIDPLSHYLRRYADDPSRLGAVKEVREERAWRCNAIFEGFISRSLSAQVLAEYRAGYSFSCPEEVGAYATRLASQEKQKQAGRVASPPPPSPSGKGETQAQQEPPRQTTTSPPSEQLNDCYLLTKIRNFSAALMACREPAEAGDTRAQTNMAQISHALGDHKAAHLWARKAAPASGDAAFLLGRMYAAGQGVPQDRKEARKWYTLATSMGHPEAGAVLAEDPGSREGGE
ncbi:tetratricopeptide repeat protein [Marinobacter sp.]|uniref:tetratricopeptide repeat protein n=1 Tax=Marinobacter sp. TaxID=50741 RepID=UPI00384D5E80